MNVRAVQKKDVIYKNGTSPLFLRFTHERKNKFVSLGVSVLPEHNANLPSEYRDLAEGARLDSVFPDGFIPSNTIIEIRQFADVVRHGLKSTRNETR
jgi:hypothetical protein